MPWEYTMNPTLKRLILSSLLLGGCSPRQASLLPGKTSDGRELLPNGWYLSPAGTQTTVGELPLNIVVTPDERYVITTDNGTANHSLTVVETATWKVVNQIAIPKGWLGLRMSNDGQDLYVAGGFDNRVRIYAFHAGDLSLRDSIVFPPSHLSGGVCVSGVDLDPATRTMYVVGREDSSLRIVSLETRDLRFRVALPDIPYTCLASRHSRMVYVSLWGGARVAVVDPDLGTVVRSVEVGEHPTDMVESPDGSRLFVANANENTVSVILVGDGRVIETLNSAVAPGLPYGSTPNAVALTPDGRTLFVANADNNMLAVFDVSTPGRSRSLGFIPTGWYPTAVKVLAGRNQIVVANGKGGGSKPNPLGPSPLDTRRSPQYIGSLFLGSLSRIDIPDDRELQRLTGEVFANSRVLFSPASPDQGNPVPSKPGMATPIKHVFYIIRENRTFDQVLGDIGKGNADPSLCIFGDSVTPNLHALVREFVLFDNFYDDAEVSADGHNWSMAAYATDYTEKTWPTSYGGRGGAYVYEGGTPIVYPAGGYIWDNCARGGVSYRTYGEFAANPSSSIDTARAMIPSLIGHTAPHCMGWDMDYSDVQRARDWMAEFDEYERNGDLPQFQTIKLPNDHTEGTRKGKLTPSAYVAQNDLALGMIVERISHSSYWGSSVIFVLEDDAQNGADHVDAHRSEALAISAWTKRRVIDSEFYTTSSVIATINHILGLPPMSQFDAAATPMYNAFATVSDPTPYVCRPAKIDIQAVNLAGAYGQEASEKMNFSREDAAPDLDLGDIVWRSVRGPDHPMPAPVRSAFMRSGKSEEDPD
jgi:YVTN family beta-propeller protein